MQVMIFLQWFWLCVAVLMAVVFGWEGNGAAVGGWVFAACCELQLIALMSK